MKIIHIADVHWRGLSRHDEYRESFLDLFSQAKQLKPDVIYIGGDIVHSKTQGISPELIDSLSWWFTEMSKIAPTHVILGNHDGLMHNHDRQDAITPIISALNNPQIHLYKKSGVYPTGVNGFNWCVFSCFDESNWDKVRPVKGEINLALFHGAVWGSKTDVDWEVDGEVQADFFKDFEFALLGDIHKTQFLNDEKTIAYCGSTIQQNYGEDEGKGFLFWDIRSKEDFDVTFHEVYHSKPFITVDWQGDVEKTLVECEKINDGSRFRIKSDVPMTQADTKQIQIELLRGKDAAEVVFKSESDFDAAKIETVNGLINKTDLRDPAIHKKLIREYYKNSSALTETDFEKFDELISKYLSRAISYEPVLRNVRWSVNKLSFDNTFAYSENNLINFDNLPGITGIFGKNTKGKSSIIGSLMYGMFNTTDRGPIKNLHIINNRKNFCRATIDITLNGEKFRVDRQTTKKQNRKGVVDATTSMALSKLNAEGEVIEDLTGEQRRETEKTLRKLVGTSDDFLMTSLASQGQMNNFIRERATARKMILTNFLDLNVFDAMHDRIKEESSELKSELRRIPTIDWDEEIDNQQIALQNLNAALKQLSKEIEKKKSALQSVKIAIATQGDVDYVSKSEINEQKSVVSSQEDRLSKLIQEKKLEIEKLEVLEEKLDKIRQVREDFPIEEMNDKLAAQNDLEKTLRELKYQHKLELQKLESKKKLAKKLEPCDCFEHKPDCQYVVQSDEHKKRIEDQQSAVNDTLEKFKAMDQSIEILKKENLQEKIEKYRQLIQRENNLEIERSEIRIAINSAENKISLKKKDLAAEREKVRALESKVIVDDNNKGIVNLIDREKKLDIELKDLETSKVDLIDKMTRAKVEISRLRKESNRLNSLRKELRTFDMLQQAVSKKGIPLQIMMSQLPIINSEIAKILHGVVGFTVELQSKSDANTMDIYIDYGDSKRIIELASGMEKMMASLALRVALINISSLPKTNMLVIDEGFGALDETNIEACSRLLTSLKKWFKNIIVISHVDAIKDTVDNFLEISKKEKDAKIYYA